MASYIIQGETLKAIADEVRDLTGISEEINPNEMITNMEQANADVAAQTEIIEQIRTALDGKAGSNAAEIGALIDQSGVLDSTEGTVEDKVEQLIEKANYLEVKFGSNPINKTVVLRLNEDWSNFAYAFTKNTNVQHIILQGLEKCNIVSYAYWCQQTTNLISVDGELDFSYINNQTNMSYMFNECVNLEEIRYKPNTAKFAHSYRHSPKLSAESIQSIFDGLATVETAQTLTLNANAKILQSQVDSANAKGWTVAGGTVVSEEEYYG